LLGLWIITAWGTEERLMWHTAGRKPVSASPAPSVPRLRLGPVPSDRTVLGGGWWPRSADPAAELPGLIRAIDDRYGRVTRLLLGPAGWHSQPRWLGGAGRAVPLDWFPGQPAGLLTAFWAGDRADLLVVPPGTAEAGALAAMDLAAQAVSLIRVPEILAALTSPAQPAGTELELSVWESEGGRLAGRADVT
jgi:Family of unknown function (DUF5994)